MNEIPEHFYASVVREELWSVDTENRRLLEERRETGFAICRNVAGYPRITAGDHLSILDADSHRLIGVDPEGLEQMLEGSLELDQTPLIAAVSRFAIATPLRVRVTRRARYVSNGSVHDAQSTTFLVVTASAPGLRRSVICTEDELESHLPLFMNGGHSTHPTTLEQRDLPILWAGGSASVLLHEALGHPAERGMSPDAHPAWLSVLDRPSGASLGSMAFDDCAVATEERLLSGGESPGCLRRESFRSDPIRRMSNLHVEVTPNAPSIELPERFMTVRFLGAGGFDPLTDRIRLTVTHAELNEGETSRHMAPFELEYPRERILRSIIAGEGPPITYPGVMCGEDGQRVPVGSAAPLLLSQSWRVS